MGIKEKTETLSQIECKLDKLTELFIKVLNNNAGVYEINFVVSCIESNQFAIFVNGAISSPVIILYGSGAGTQSNVGQGILTLNSGDIISIVNNSSPAAVTLQQLAGGTQVNVNASIIIKRLS